MRTLLASFLTLVALIQPAAEPRFPALRAESLAGATLALPGDFAGERNVVIVAFARAQQASVDTWAPHVHAWTARDPRVRFYELPTLGRGLRLMRPMIDGGMRRGIPDSATRAATITLYIDKDAFRRALAIDREDRIAVLLVDRAGRVSWRANGPFTPALAASLDSALAR